MTIIGIAGRKGHGKDTAANFLVDLQGFVNIKFASGIKQIATSFFHFAYYTAEQKDLSTEELFELTDGSRKEESLELLHAQGNNLFRQFMEEYNDLLEEIFVVDIRTLDVPEFKGTTSREFQQFIGTEVGRNLVGETVWTDAAIREANEYENVVISDVRFPNEVEVIQNEGGYVYRIERPGVTDTGFSNHPSEALIDTLDVDGVISNDGTLRDLREQVIQLYKERL